MKNGLVILLNLVFRKDLTILYGEGSMIEVNSVKYSTTTKKYCIDCTLKISDVEMFEESKMDGLKYLIEQSWKFIGENDSEIYLISNFELIN